MAVLVYFDNADFVWMERLQATDPDRWAEFLQRWHDGPFRLALSFHHAQEFGQMVDAASIDRRIDLLRSFEPRTCFGNIGSLRAMELEIAVQFDELAWGESARANSLRDCMFPPAGIDNFEQVIREAEREIKRVRGLLEACAETANWSDRTNRELVDKLRTRGQRWPRPPGEDFDWDRAWELFRRSWEHDGLGHDERTRIERLFRPWFDHAKREGSSRRGSEAVLGLKGIPGVGEFADENLAELGMFYGRARAAAIELADMMGIPRHFFAGVITELDPFRCPGMRLKLAVQRARGRARKPQEPGDDIDEEHLMFVPYVDLAFVDKRTLDYARRETGEGRQKLPQGSLAMMRRGGSLERVSSALLEMRGAT